jgi:hypothetical protein
MYLKIIRFLMLFIVIFPLKSCRNEGRNYEKVLIERVLSRLREDYGITDARVIDVYQSVSVLDSSKINLIEGSQYAYYNETGGYDDTLYFNGEPPFFDLFMITFLIKSNDLNEVYVYSADQYLAAQIDNFNRVGKTPYFNNNWISIDSLHFYKDFPRMPRNSEEGIRYWNLRINEFRNDNFMNEFNYFDFLELISHNE